MNQTFMYRQPFPLEGGGVLPELHIAYCTYGKLNAAGDNVVWICHALTANADAADWWSGLVGDGCAINPADSFIVCANIIGSCYGTTGPMSLNPDTGKAYGHAFPLVSIRDMVQAHILLRRALGITSIRMLAGGSMGGYQALEWAIAEPEVIRSLFLLATGAAESPWGIAIHTAQRLAIEADGSWGADAPDAGAKGLKAARAIGMLTYRNYALFSQQQADADSEKLEGFRAAAYIHHQGEKLVKRFNAYSYHLLSRAMDTHNISRGRNASSARLLQLMKQPALIIGISSDILCPVEEQEALAAHMPAAQYEVIDSPYGHDGFLVEAEAIGKRLQGFCGRLPPIGSGTQ